MGRIFVSHSSADNVATAALKDWLVKHGWDDLFVDFDPQRGIVAGQRWERSLAEAANRCEAVLFVLSDAWLNSDWCLRELDFAVRLNKQIFGILVEDISRSRLPSRLTDTWQLINLARGADHEMLRTVVPGTDRESHISFSAAGLKSLKIGLQKAGLDARFFSWPPPGEPDRPPWRGLAPLQAEDAGIFFGREASTIEALDQLRGMLETKSSNIMVILGASGAGKSSFLRAGLWPRLCRDDRNFLPLPVIRPERAAVLGPTGLVQSLEASFRKCGISRTRANIIQELLRGKDYFRSMLSELSEKSKVDGKAPTIVISIDQAEELFTGSGPSEARYMQFIIGDILENANASDASNAVISKTLQFQPSQNVIVIFTIRSDAFEALQVSPTLEGKSPKIFSLPPLPPSAWAAVIEGPAARVALAGRKLELQPALITRVLADLQSADSKDSLPLLSFALERLHFEYGGDGNLSVADYDAFGGLEGAIEAAVSGALAAADADRRIPLEAELRFALLRKAFIPWLAGIDVDAGMPRRNVCRFSDLPEETRPLIEHLIAARLLTTDLSPGARERTIELAHEALLRQWPVLKGWLQQDATALAQLDGVARASRDWIVNNRIPSWLVHKSGRLEDAERLHLRPDLAAKFTTDELNYLSSCRSSEDETKNQELLKARELAEAQLRVATATAEKVEEQRKVVRRTRLGLVGALLLASVAAITALWGLIERSKAEFAARQATNERNASEAANARLSVRLAKSFSSDGEADKAALLLLHASNSPPGASKSDEMLIAFSDFLHNSLPRRAYNIPENATGIAGVGALYFVDPANRAVVKFDGQTDPKAFYLSDVEIVKIGSTTNGDLLVLGMDESVERITRAGNRMFKGRLPALRQVHGREYTGQIVSIHGNGVVVVETYFQEDGGKSGTVTRILDSSTKATKDIYGEMNLIYLVGYDGSQYLLDRSGARDKLFKMGVSGVTLTIDEVSSNDVFIKDLFVNTCVVDGLNSGMKDKSAQWNKTDFNTGAFENYCIVSGENLIYSKVESSSSGPDRTDLLFTSDTEPEDVKDFATDAGIETTADISWVGLNSDASLIALVINRTLLVYDRDDQQLRLKLKLAGTPGPAMFLSDRKLAVADFASNSVEVINIDDRSLTEIFDTTDEQDVLEGGKLVSPLNHQACDDDYPGVTTALKRQLTLPDGSVLDYGGVAEDKSSPLIRLLRPDGSTSQIDLTSEKGELHCIAFSKNGLLALKQYHLGKVVLGNLSDLFRDAWTSANVTTLPILSSSSAVFVGNTNDILTSDNSYSVKRWKCDRVAKHCSVDELYRGDSPILYAEGNIDATTLLMLEGIGDANIRGILYSTSAKEKWFDIGENYKYFGAAFAFDQSIIIASGDKLDDVLRLPKLEDMRGATARSLPARCKERSPGNYRTSSCWPLGF
jgi:hypothetical protein